MGHVVIKSQAQLDEELKIILKAKSLYRGGEYNQIQIGKKLGMRWIYLVRMAYDRGYDLRVRARLTPYQLKRKLIRLYYPWCNVERLAREFDSTERNITACASSGQWERVTSQHEERWLDPWMFKAPPIHIRDIVQIMELVLKYTDYYIVAPKAGYSITAIRDTFGGIVPPTYGCPKTA